MKKLKQTSLDQTGMAIFETTEGKEKYVPLFSLHPIEEANNLMALIPGLSFRKNIYFSNNLLTYKIEDAIEEYMKDRKNLPEDYMEELVSGFPFIKGLDPQSTIAFYK